MSDKPQPETPRVFLSSTYRDNKERREGLITLIGRAKCAAVTMEYWTASEKRTKQKCLAHVAEAQVFIGIVAWRYGWIPPGEEKSITELEYEEAGRLGIPRLMFLLDAERQSITPGVDLDSDPQAYARLLAFRQRIQQDPETTRPFTDRELPELVLQALYEWKTPTAPSPGTETRLQSAGEYIKYVREQNSHIRLAGFKTSLRMALSFEDLWVPLALQRQAHEDHLDRARSIETKPPADWDPSREVEVTLAARLQRLFEPNAGRKLIVLLGHPGAGKTTQLRHVAFLMASHTTGPTALGLERGLLPMLLPLRFLEPGDGSLQQFAQRLLGDPNLNLPQQLVTGLFDRRLLLLLDGLDEVPEAQRGRVRTWIEAAVQGPKGHRAIVSCRFLGYRDEVKLEPTLADVLEVRPLTLAQRNTLIDNWYQAVELADAECGPGDAACRARAEAKAIAEATDLKARLSDTSSPQLYALTTNPLLLTAMCLVHRDRGQHLPERRVELYAECIEGLLELWRDRQQRQYRASARPSARFPAAQAKEVLAPMAYWLHQRGETHSSGTLLAPVVQKAFSQARIPPNLSAEDFLDTIRDESGLVTGFSDTQYGFLHLRFQEYLAAYHLRGHLLELAPRLAPEAFREVVQQELVARFDDPWWAEVLHCLFADLTSKPLYLPFFSALLRDDRGPRAAARVKQLVAEIPYFLSAPFVELLEDPAATDPGQRGLALEILRTQAPELMPAQTVAHQLVSLTERLQLAVAGLTFVGIPAGEFLMGTPKGEEGRLPWEWKPHKVHVPAFEMAITPVTNAQYGRYLAEVKSVEPPKYWGDERYNQPDQPVVGVSWDEAVAYCSWAEAKLSDGSRIRLPSEAEWEYACRAGTKSRFWSGDKDEDLAEVGWFFQNSGRVLHAVAEKRPNPFGLQDMHGNIWEWCLDWMCGEGSKHARAVAAQHPAPCDEKYRSDPHRVIRGGSFADEARFARSAYRVGSHPGDRDTDRGFRPVRVTP